MDPVINPQGQALPLMYNPYGMPTLPPGWIEYRTPTGQPYWYNTFTKQTSWIFPIHQSQPQKKKKQIKKKIPNTHWLFVITHDGYEFYYDRETKKSVWEMPEELKEPMELLKKMEEEEKNKKGRLKKQNKRKRQNKKITSPFAVYSVEYPKLISDPRFSLVANNKQKNLFNKHCSALGEKIKNEKISKKKPEDEFRDLLWSKVTEKMYWEDFRRKYRDDPRFKALASTKEKEILFKDHVKHQLGKKKRNPKEDYMELLRSTKEIQVGIRWRDAKRILEKDDRYYAIESKLEREDLFRDYLDELSAKK
ncbi:uncharacterized protein BX663DRAFT_489655 [Cokeromyces recurvatus]|uniref:uncharacterized protein n=1 Tax=Cokeromyces recurvatus TaxID=90255 RepID=UPI00221ED86F|nr:uncharacterized protein BX663DRAFT_489655 [Cokeromyces recurvatus]KAI7898880.1 hypothetical protein BX663DRAFT_489655 [Cokeromyces recurvatus]